VGDRRHFGIFRDRAGDVSAVAWLRHSVR